MFPLVPFARPAGSFQSPLPVPPTPPNGGVPCVIVISQDWLQALSGAAAQLTLQSTWGDLPHDDLINQQMAGFLVMELIGSAMTLSDFLRFQQTDCGLAVSFDGGVTYAPIYDGVVCVTDEINNGTLAAGNGSSGTPTTAEPPWPISSVPPGQDGGCLTAANITDIWTQQWTQMEAGFSAGQTAIQAAAALAGLLAVFIPIEAVVFEFLGVMDALFAVGTSAFDDLISSTVTDFLQCTIFCNCASDGSITATQFGNMIAEVSASTLDSLTKNTMLLWLHSNGPVGLMRMGAAAGVTTADCTTCACSWCYEYNFEISDGGWQPSTAGQAVYTPGVGWQSEFYTPPPTTLAAIVKTFDLPFTPHTMEVHYDATIVGSGVNGLVFGSVFSNPAMAGGTDVVQTLDPIDVTSDTATVLIYSNYGGNAGSVTIKKVIFRGVFGVGPGDSNC